VEKGFPNFGRKRGFHVGLKIKSTFVCYRCVSSWFTYQAFGFPLSQPFQRHEYSTGFLFTCEFTLSFPHCKDMIKMTQTKQRTICPLHCTQFQNEQPEPGFVSTCLDPPEVTVKISSEVETLPVRAMNYNIHNDKRKGECGY
jgi:hypothetical protein